MPGHNTMVVVFVVVTLLLIHNLNDNIKTCR